MSLMTALIKYAEHPKSPPRMMYVRLDARLDPIFNANKAGRLNECIFTYFTYNKKNPKNKDKVQSCNKYGIQ